MAIVKVPDEEIQAVKETATFGGEPRNRAYHSARDDSSVAKCYVCEEVAKKERMLCVGRNKGETDRSIWRCEPRCKPGSPSWMAFFSHKSEFWGPIYRKCYPHLLEGNNGNTGEESGKKTVRKGRVRRSQAEILRERKKKREKEDRIEQARQLAEEIKRRKSEDKRKRRNKKKNRGNTASTKTAKSKPKTRRVGNVTISYS